MNILILCSGNTVNFDFKIHQAFIYDQVESIKLLDKSITFDYFFIKGHGIKGYISNYKDLFKKIKTNKYDIIHAHVALSGLLANLQRVVPVITTFHGSDINVIRSRYISYFVEKLSARSIFVSEKLLNLAIKPTLSNCSVIPCGVDFDVFNIKQKDNLKEKWSFDLSKRYILFSSSFDNEIKNYSLLNKSLKLIDDMSIKVIELKGYTRNEVAELMNIVDVCVMTSFTEGSPQFIKEAMACNCPIVSTDVGDVKDVISGIEGCNIVGYEPIDVASKLIEAFVFGRKTKGRNNIMKFDNNIIAVEIIKVYKSIINK